MQSHLFTNPISLTTAGIKQQERESFLEVWRPFPVSMYSQSALSFPQATFPAIVLIVLGFFAPPSGVFPCFSQVETCAQLHQSIFQPLHSIFVFEKPLRQHWLWFQWSKLRQNWTNTIVNPSNRCLVSKSPSSTWIRWLSNFYHFLVLQVALYFWLKANKGKNCATGRLDDENWNCLGDSSKSRCRKYILRFIFLSTKLTPLISGGLLLVSAKINESTIIPLMLVSPNMGKAGSQFFLYFTSPQVIWLFLLRYLHLFEPLSFWYDDEVLVFLKAAAMWHALSFCSLIADYLSCFDKYHLILFPILVFPFLLSSLPSMTCFHTIISAVTFRHLCSSTNSKM